MSTTIIREASEAESDDIAERLVAFNRAAAGPENLITLRLASTDASGAVIGGVVAFRSWQTLLIDVLWVDAAWRGSGIGGALMQRAEEWGKANGCRLAVLETSSFQAEPFYLKRGYAVVGKIDGWPPGGWFNQMSKILS